MSNSLGSHGLQHTRLPCPSPTPGVCSNSCLSRWWYHPTISSSVFSFSSRLQSFPASGSFPLSQFFISRGQSIGASASARVLWMNIQGDLLAVQGTLESLLQDHSSKASILQCSAFSIVQLSSIHGYWKSHSLTTQTFIIKVMSLLFNILTRFVIAFLPAAGIFYFHGYNHGLQWFLKHNKIKAVTLSSFPL